MMKKCLSEQYQKRLQPKHSLVNKCVLYITNVTVEFNVSFSSNSNFKEFNVHSKKFKAHQPQGPGTSFYVVKLFGSFFVLFPHQTLLGK